MKQLTLPTYGDADVLEIVEVPRPTPGEGELLIEVEASGVNYADILRRRNTYFMPTPLPYVLGVEVVGTLVEAGSKPDGGVSVGDRVLALLPSGGGYAEYVTTPAAYCIPLPPHVDSNLVKHIDPLRSKGHALQEALLDCNRMAMGEVTV